MCYGGQAAPSTLTRAVAALCLALVGSVAVAEERATPEETVRRYLQSMKDGKFDVTYELVSKAMKGGKDREVWIKEQTAQMQWADVKIFEFRVYPGKIEGERASVPNILSSQDRFVNQLGLTEHELYTLVKEDGAWKVDQQLIVEPADVPKWFPEGKKGEGKPSPGAPPSH